MSAVQISIERGELCGGGDAGAGAFLGLHNASARSECAVFESLLPIPTYAPPSPLPYGECARNPHQGNVRNKGFGFITPCITGNDIFILRSVFSTSASKEGRLIEGERVFYASPVPSDDGRTQTTPHAGTIQN
eukprot:gene18071-biopygen42315